MAKIPLSTIKIVDIQENKEIEYEAENQPMKSTVGNCYFGPINAGGIAELKAKGTPVTSDKQYCALIARALGLSPGSVGVRGPGWNDAAARKRYKVFINGQEFNPPFTPKQVEKQQAVTEKATPAVPDTTETTPEQKHAENIGIIKEAIKKGMAKEVVIEKLTGKFGEEKANAMYDEATQVKQPEVIESMSQAFDIGEPQQAVKQSQSKPKEQPSTSFF